MVLIAGLWQRDVVVGTRKNSSLADLHANADSLLGIKQTRLPGESRCQQGQATEAIDNIADLAFQFARKQLMIE
jgi:hypothetical protein